MPMFVMAELVGAALALLAEQGLLTRGDAST
jgi:hypothetical protein